MSATPTTARPSRVRVPWRRPAEKRFRAAQGRHRSWAPLPQKARSPVKCDPEPLYAFGQFPTNRGVDNEAIRCVQSCESCRSRSPDGALPCYSFLVRTP
jgi:hypothetical protein